MIDSVDRRVIAQVMEEGVRIEARSVRNTTYCLAWLNIES